MTRPLLFTLLFLWNFFPAFSQPKVVFTSDIDHFWEAYDSCRATTDSLRQLNFIQKLYIDRGTPGLAAFMRARNYTAQGWVHAIRSYPRFWATVRPRTLTVATRVPEMEASVRRFRELYPGLKDAAMYFTVGCLHSGGTTEGNMVLVGAEVATGDSTVDCSELPGRWLEPYFHHPDDVVRINVHEYVHTQQRGDDHVGDLFGFAVMEGGADFVAELVSGIPLTSVYLVYGRAHEAGLKERFAGEMFQTYYDDWFYNARTTKGTPDLGYFMGYAICSAYYRRAADKRQALADIIRFDGLDTAAEIAFIDRSGYFGPSVDRRAVMGDFARRRVVAFGAPQLLPILLVMKSLPPGK
ncbi:MAG TPA: hypothetical protein VL547_20535 [Dinghuibacter sp.]|jgi:hypothetical protein|uniref:hypothetical protein n=1 Tax=Dinghuibacter sp. TaxID=2024697 RepID=UPI002B7019BF|nr:hypothetical protein [Dinghuibacter sp.]HTJ14443.1 hypothetical protein [Dinghuibacter sp.]